MDKPNAEGHLEKTLEVAKFCVEAGLLVSCFFIVAYPGGGVSRTKYLKRAEYQDYFLRHGKNVYMKGEDEQSFETTLAFCRELKSLGVQGITPLIATPYPGTELYDFCAKFDCLAFPDEKNVLTTVSYSALKPDYVQVDSPWCSRQTAFDRWREMMDMFSTYHNVRKFEGDVGDPLSGSQVGQRLGSSA